MVFLRSYIIAAFALFGVFTLGCGPSLPESEELKSSAVGRTLFETEYDPGAVLEVLEGTWEGSGDNSESDYRIKIAENEILVARRCRLGEEEPVYVAVSVPIQVEVNDEDPFRGVIRITSDGSSIYPGLENFCSINLEKSSLDYRFEGEALLLDIVGIALFDKVR